MKNKVPMKKYDITQCALYKCRSKRRLEKILRLEQGGLKEINDIIRYHFFEIDKKNSHEKRKITAPDRKLKLIQRRILYLLQDGTSGFRGSSLRISRYPSDQVPCPPE